jgi:hypothetical protein
VRDSEFVAGEMLVTDGLTDAALISPPLLCFHPVVLFFYPLDFTFVCPTEILAFNDRAEEFSKINCQLIGASVDSVYAHHAWVAVSTLRAANNLCPCAASLVLAPSQQTKCHYPC